MKRPDAAAVFAGLALLFGSIFVFLIPPFQSPDEPNHFLRAFQVSEGVFFPETADRRLGGNLPASLTQVCDSFSFLKMNYDARLNKKLIINCLKIPLDKTRRAFADFPNTAIYAPTAYLPQAIASGALRICGGTPLEILYVARLSNLLFWVLLVSAAIRMMPFAQHLLAAIALLPASLIIAASANADVVTNGLCWWLTASFFRLAFVRPAPASAIFAKQLIAFIIVCANKLIALPLVLLHLLHHPHESRKKRMLSFGMLAGAGLAVALLWGGLVSRRFIPYDAYNPAVRDAQTLNEGVDPARQLAFTRAHPLDFARTAAVSAVRALPSIAAHFAGKFGWEKNYLHPAWLVMLWLALASTAASTANPVSAGQRMTTAAVAILYIGMFSVTMYVLWCPVGALELTNFQGRYFVPVAPVAALVFASGWLRRFQRKIGWFAVAVLSGGNIAMAFAVWQRYYG